MLTTHSLQVGGQSIVDASLEEESVKDASVSIAVNRKQEIAAIESIGKKGFSASALSISLQVYAVPMTSFFVVFG